MPGYTITFSRVIHLSHVIAPGMPQWPGDPPLAIGTTADLAAHGYRLRRVAIGEHSATHLNAPASFHADGAGVDAYPAEALVVAAVCIDARRVAEADADYRLSPAGLAAWEASHGPVPAGALVILHTGWGERWADPRAFFNADAGGGMHFPGFSAAVVEVLIEQRKIGGIGIDTHGVDGGTDTTFAVNRRVLSTTRLVLENLANLEEMPTTGATVVVGPLRLKNGTGSPAAVLALVP
jgi:kynurenine formamidase